MMAINDPLLGSTGSQGKIKLETYHPEDDEALMRLFQKIESIGGANLE